MPLGFAASAGRPPASIQARARRPYSHDIRARVDHTSCGKHQSGTG